MGCGCGANKNNPLKNRRPGARNMNAQPRNRALGGLNKPIANVNKQNPLLEQRRLKERTRRDNILKALKRP